ncbi:MAG: hypothetical protein NTW79_00045 [Candidatus Berkelbacteria bacterium]|nr:hypothetical protein [Candidatus Berkelbacteria bacterium]
MTEMTIAEKREWKQLLDEDVLLEPPAEYWSETSDGSQEVTKTEVTGPEQ